MATSAAIGYRSKFYMFDSGQSPAAFVALGEVTNIEPPSDEIDLVDATHMDSPNRRREYIAGLTDGGDVVVEGNYVPGGATDDLIILKKDLGAAVSCKIQFPNNITWVFDAIITGYEIQVPVDDKMTYTLTAKATGTINVGVVT